MGKYTKQTAALKATTIDARQIKAKQLIVEKLDGSELDIGSIEKLDTDTVYQDHRFDNITDNDLVGQGVEVTLQDNVETVTHYNDFVFDFRGADSPLNVVDLILKGAGFTKTVEENENVYNFFAYVDSDNLRGGNARWIVKTLLSNHPPVYKNLLVLDGYTEQDVVELEGTNMDINLSSLMMMGTNSLANIRNADHLRLNLVAPKLRYIQEAINNSNIIIASGDLSAVAEAPKAFSATSTETGTLDIFECSLYSLMDGFCTFQNQPLTTFTSALPLLMQGVNMFKNTKLSLHSLENIANTLPAVDYTKRYKVYFSYPQLFDEFTYDYAMGERLWKSGNIGELTISWQDPSTIDEIDRVRIVNELFYQMNLKGWTIDTNVGIDQQVQGIFAKVEKVAPEFATHTDSAGNNVMLRTAKYVYGPKQDTWTKCDSEEAAVSHFNLTAI